MSVEADHQTASAPGGVSRPNPVYAFKSSLAGGASKLELTDDALVWLSGYRKGVWPYREISALQMSYRPMSMQSQRFRMDIIHKSGTRLKTFSTNWHSIASMPPQNAEYSVFVRALHEKLRASGHDVVLAGGLNPIVHKLGLFMLGVLFVSLFGLLGRSVATNEYAGVLFILGIAAVFGWQSYSFMRRNRPQRYTYQMLPPELMP